MIILYLHQFFNTPSNQSGTRSYDLAKEFVNQGHKVVMITSGRDKFEFNNNRTWNITNVDGIDVRVLTNDYNNKMSYLRRIFSFMKYSIFTSLYILNIKADIVLATSTPLSIAVPALIKKIFHRVPYIFEVRDVWPEAPAALGVIRNRTLIKILERFEFFIYKNALTIVPLSTDMKESIRRRFRGNPNMVVIPNISEINRFAVARESNRSISPVRVVLYAGAISTVNHLDYAVNLAREIYKMDRNIHFHIYGVGNRLDYVKNLAHKEGVLDLNFFFKGLVSKAELPLVYSQCSVATSFVANIPALWANSANKFFDTLAAGRPVVINHEGWQAEEIRSKNIGYVLDHNCTNFAAEATRFVNYLNNSNLLLEQSENSYKLALKEYSLDVAVGRYLSIFETLNCKKYYNEK